MSDLPSLIRYLSIVCVWIVSVSPRDIKTIRNEINKIKRKIRDRDKGKERRHGRKRETKTETKREQTSKREIKREHIWTTTLKR